MSAAGLVLRIIVASVLVITIGTIAVFGFTVLEPFYSAFGEPPASLGWGSPALNTVTFAALGFLGLIVVLIVWFVSAPIRNDRRQGYRR